VFYAQFHQKYTKIYLKIGTKSSDWKFYRDKKLKKFFRRTKTKNWYIYRDQNLI